MAKGEVLSSSPSLPTSRGASSATTIRRMLIEADATDPSAASGAISTLTTVASQALLREQGMQAAAPRRRAGQLQVVVHRRYNPEGISQYNIVPGLLGVILQMTMVMMTAMALTRETERGTMENLLAMPASPTEIMLGKMLPYLVVGGVQVAVVLTAAKALFNVPFVGSLPLLLSAVLAFVMALVLLGYTISTVARTQMQAMQLTFFFFLPSLLLVRLHVPLSRHAAMGAEFRRDLPAHAFPADRARGDAEGRRFPGDRDGDRGADDLHLRLCRAGVVPVPADAGLRAVSSSPQSWRRVPRRARGSSGDSCFLAGRGAASRRRSQASKIRRVLSVTLRRYTAHSAGGGGARFKHERRLQRSSRRQRGS